MNEIEKQHQELNCKLRLEIKELEAIIHSQAEEIKKLYEENKQLKEDMIFCLVSIRQERKMSTDERTRKEMKTCEEILSKYE